MLCINNSLFHLTAISLKTQELQDINPAAALVCHAFANLIDWRRILIRNKSVHPVNLRLLQIVQNL